MLTFVVLSLVVEVNENGIHNQFQVKHWNDWQRNQESQKAVHQNHEGVLDLQNEIIKSFTLENYNWNHKWKHDDTDWEESDGYSSVKFVITVRVLQLYDVHSSQSFQVVPNKLVSVNEHSNQEAKKHYVEDKNKQCNENLSLRELILRKVLLPVKPIKDI